MTRQVALLEVTLLPETGDAETIRTTDEHPFWVDGTGWRRADGLAPGDMVQTMAGLSVVQAVHFTSRRTTVYNLTVDGDPNYFVGPDGVWVHNCGAGLHHLIARYLSVGDLKSSLRYGTRLTSAEHTALHKLINEEGSRFNIPFKEGGRKKVEEWVAQVGDSNAQAAIAEALMAAHARFDQMYGHATYPVLVAELRRLGF